MVIEFLRSLYDQNTPLPKAEHTYKEILDDIEYFGISSQVYHLLKQKGLLEQTPLPFQEKLKQEYTKTLYQNLFIKNQTEMILREFEKEGIEVIPLKGSFFAEKYFGHIGARSTSDIDILVKRDDLERAIEILRGLVFFPDPKPVPSGFNLTFNKILPQSTIPLMVELHWNILDLRTSSVKIDEFWQAATPINGLTYVKGLSDFHTFYLIVLHGWRHNMGSLKYFIDIIQLLQNRSIDYHLLFALAKEEQTYSRVLRTLAIVNKQFPELSSDVSVPKTIAGQCWQYSTIRCPQNKSLLKYVDFIDYQFGSYDSIFHSLKELWIWLFPPRHFIETELEFKENNISIQRLHLKMIMKRSFNLIKMLFAR